MTMGTEKLKKCKSQIFVFENSPHTFFHDWKSIFQNVKMFEIMKKSEISQIVLQKSMTEKKDFIFHPNFFWGAPEKWLIL